MPDRPLRILVVAGGDSGPLAGVSSVLPSFDVVVAADSGVHHALALGVHVDVVVGDFDSARHDAIDAVAADGARLERHPVAKDQTDLELALDRACQIGGSGAEIVVLASVGGRLDHALANLLALASPAYAECSVRAFVDRWSITVLRDETRRLAVRSGALVTLLVIDAHAVRVTTQGLRYPLHDEPVFRSSTRGVSNVAEAPEIEVRVDGGVLFVLHEWAD